MSVVQLSYIKILAEIAERVGLEMPTCEVALTAQGAFQGCINIQIVRSGSVVETIRCCGSPYPDYAFAIEDAAQVAIQRLKNELNLEIKDVNYEDYLMYKNLYDNVAVQNADLFGQLHNLKRDHDLLKDCYDSVVAGKAESVAEQAWL